MVFWKFCSAEILLRLAEIAYEPNDGHLEIIKKSFKFVEPNDGIYFEFHHAHNVVAYGLKSAIHI